MPVFSVSENWRHRGIRKIAYKQMRLYQVSITTIAGDYRILEISAFDEDDLLRQVADTIAVDYPDPDLTTLIKETKDE